MSGTQTRNGKAFEYACINSLYQMLSENEQVEVLDSPQLQTAKQLYESESEQMQRNMTLASRAAIHAIMLLEPQLQYGAVNSPLYLSVQTDAQGIAGDVRDVVCVRRQNGWQIGLSCKHNHRAVKHSRLSDRIDFGYEWFGYPCSQQYFDEVVPIFGELRELRDESRHEGVPVLWEDLADKEGRYYIPILRAFMRELIYLSEVHKDVPQKLVQYLMGRYDFYKIITDDKLHTTRVEGINLNGTLNKPAGVNGAIVNIPRLELPSQFYHIGLNQWHQHTVDVVCDLGWQFSMRIHNASKKIEPSLKFDIQLMSLPESVYAQVEPWQL